MNTRAKKYRLSHILKYCLSVACVLFVTVLHAQPLPLIKISANKRFFQTANGQPFFWLGDTGWLLFHKTTREEAVHYLDIRQQQGYNVVQVMVMHSLPAKNVYGHFAVKNNDLSQPIVTPGNNPQDNAAYDYWDHVDFIIKEAEKRGIYMVLVPIWGSDVKDGKVSVKQAEAYARFLAGRYKNQSNIIWLNGGDIRGTEGMPVWQAIGKTIKQVDKTHLLSFHPRGRYSSSEWFHKEPWLDFNMFQSGHKTYAQDTNKTDKNFYGEDNWRYVKNDYALLPVKPTLDGEPSYENIPYGLHDSLMPRWNPAELRRYAYWNVFAGGAGFTYGENAIMQFHKKGDADANYGVTDAWTNTIYAKGATQMQYLKKLMLSKSYFNRVPAQEIVADNDLKRYDYILATKGTTYAMLYTYTGRNFKVNTAKLGFKVGNSYWYNPQNGEKTNTKGVASTSLLLFDPPGEPANGNDWVLVIEK